MPSGSAHPQYRHGDANRTPEYTAWINVRQRCGNPGYTGYQNYGGRGIRVCARWQSSYEAFLADVGRRPSPGHSIERIDNDGDYEPSNVRWASRREQALNRRPRSDAFVYEHDGVVLSLSAWAERVGLSRGALRSRLTRGWSFERAITEPRNKSKWDNQTQ